MKYNIRLLENFIKEYFPELPENVIIECNDRIYCYYLFEAVTKKELTENAKQTIADIADRTIKIKSSDLTTFIVNMNDFCRENSHGAVKLSIVFISENDDSVCINNSKVAIVKTKYLSKGHVIAICEPKFDGIPSDKLVFEGILGD